MIKEFNNEPQAKAIAESLGLIITKYKGVYLVSNSKEEMLARYGLGYFQKEGVFYDKEVFEIDEYDFLVIKNKNIVNASSVEIPYNLKRCSCMFSGCTSLEIPSIIPERVESCSYIFMNCTSLKEPPIIPEGAFNCRAMFYCCTSLVTPPIIPSSVTNCAYMFGGCSSLKEPPIIPESVEDCMGMFAGCSSLKTPPIIPESVEDCRGMFGGCSSLKEPPHFPVNCYTAGALDGTPFEKG